MGPFSTLDTALVFYYRFTANMDGDYQFCLDNTFSRFSDKIVFFELITDEDNEEPHGCCRFFVASHTNFI